ncbi:MAG: FKBP-type peptidyl-prolyl cis-trans isomerase [Nitrospirales bacterium]
MTCERRTLGLLVLTGILGFTLLAAAEEPGETTIPPDAETTLSGLKYVDLVRGGGQVALPGDLAIVHYTGWLTNGAKFDSSRDRDQPLGFRLSAGQVIKGWEEGVKDMRVGGKRKLFIPPELGYGPEGVKGIIPPNAMLIFEVELLDLR